MNAITKPTKARDGLYAECPAVNTALGAALVATAELEAARLRICDIVPDQDEQLQPFCERVNEADETIAETEPTTLTGLRRSMEWFVNFDPHRNDYVNTTWPKTMLAAITKLAKGDVS